MPNDTPTTQTFFVHCKFSDWRGINHTESIPIVARTKGAAEQAALHLLKKHNPAGLHVDFIQA